MPVNPSPPTLMPSDADPLSALLASLDKLAPHNVVFDASGVPAASKEVAQALSRPNLLFKVGESVEVPFPADAAEGVYKYYCQPNRGAGQVGAITVKE